VKALLDKGVYDMQELADGGWVTALRYEDEIVEDLKKKTGGKDDEVSGVKGWGGKGLGEWDEVRCWGWWGKE
jgi:hypothetical protein